MSPPTDTPAARSDAEPEDRFQVYDQPRPSPSGRPWLLANMVAGVDGSLAWHGRVGELSSADDRSLFVRLRGLVDGVLVGAGTVRAEGYGPVRLPEAVRARRVRAGRPPVPPLVVVSRSLDLDWDAPLFTEASTPSPVVVTSAASPSSRRERAEEVAHVVVAGEESVDLAGAMGTLGGLGMGVVLTEGGPHLLDGLVEAGVLDELCLTVAPVYGGDPLTMATRPGPAHRLSRFALASVRSHRDEVYLRYLVHPDDPAGRSEER